MSEQVTATVRRVMLAPPEAVYDEWLDPDALRDWMCPRPARAVAVECDPRIGGGYRLDIDDLGQRMVVTGRYLELDRPHRLSFTWWCSTWEPTDPDSVVTVTFEPVYPDRTLMTIEHGTLRPDLVDRHAQGWVRIADQFADALAG